MTDPLCIVPDCGRPADGYLCHRCTATLQRILAELPATLTELTTTITRQARTSRSGGGKPTKASDPPLPFDIHSSGLLDRVRNGLTTWIRHLCESRGVETYEGPTHLWGGCQHESCKQIRSGVPAITRTEDMATWLVAHIDSIRQDEAAAELLTNLKTIQAELRAAIDNREYRYAGPCTAVLQMGDIQTNDTGNVISIVPTVQRPCGADLRAREGAKTIVCRNCGAEYNAAERSNWIDKKSADELASAAVIAHALADAGYRVKPVTIRKWADRTRKWMIAAARRKDGDPPLRYEDHPIQQVACSVDGRLPLYRVGDVYRRVKADPERRQVGA